VSAGKEREGELDFKVFDLLICLRICLCLILHYHHASNHTHTHILTNTNYRYVFNEMNHRFPTLPFTLRALEDEKQARMGVVECLKHDLLHPYPVRVLLCLRMTLGIKTQLQ